VANKQVKLCKQAPLLFQLGERENYYELQLILTFKTFRKQEAQLSQRDRAPLSVIQYFATSLKVIQNDNDCV